MFTSDEAADADEDEPVVLLRCETSPEDIPGMAVSAGVITGRAAWSATPPWSRVAGVCCHIFELTIELGELAGGNIAVVPDN